MLTILDQSNLVIPLPLDARQSNVTLNGSTITIETIPEYLQRVDSDCRYLGLEVNVYSPAGEYDITLLASSINSGYITLEDYKFQAGVADNDFDKFIKGDTLLVIDSLDSTSETDALSANQGRELKLLFETVGGVEQYDTFAEFPLVGSDAKLYIDKSTTDPYYWSNDQYNKLGVFTEDLQVSLSSNKNYLKWGSNELIPAQGLTPKELLTLGAVEAIPPTLMITSPTTVSFNQTDISNVINYTYTINSLGGIVTTLFLDFKRGVNGSWEVINNDVNSSTFTHTLTDSEYNTLPFYYRLRVSDNKGGGNTSSSLIITPTAYISPSITSFSVGDTTRELGDVSSTITATLAKNSTYVPMTSYSVEYSTNNSTWNNVTISSITDDTLNISHVHNNTDLINNKDVYYRVKVVDGYATKYSNVIHITFVNGSTIIYSTSTSITLSDVQNLLLTDSKSRTISGVTANTGYYTFYVYASTAGDLTSVILDGAAPVLGAFTKLSDITGVNSFGANVSYIVYKSNATKAFTNNTLTFS